MSRPSIEDVPVEIVLSPLLYVYQALDKIINLINVGENTFHRYLHDYLSVQEKDFR